MRTVRYRGRATALYWEYIFLAQLSHHGRLVSLPDTVRTFRLLHDSDGINVVRERSWFDLLVLSLRARLVLLRCAWGLPLPFAQRWKVVETTLRNLAGSN